MSDFEVHPRGTAQEIKLSRELADVIKQEMEQWGEGIHSHHMRLAFNRLQAHYQKQIENGETA